ncbi:MULTISPECIES: DUF6516 family protein [Halopenitus]|uniref:Uncharacterized protein n=1 Tax=Halopenitus malekzadehii TaxID=1267564 RepID=A0A1H6JHF7_9EURY|nr:MULTISPECIES: DUF6516 family protein [Halopenitus]SEH58532.1 hypothetical protein SAMN05192561_10968 [Halopenitus malekzadehii]
MDARIIRDFTNTFDGYVERQTIIETDDPAYPSGYKYSLHFGTLDGETVLRYDNAHEDTKGHERHTSEGVTEIEFPGMIELLERFETEVDERRP